MDDMAINRQRYPRRNVPARRRTKKGSNTSSKYIERLMRQLLVCITIMVAIGIIQNVNTSATNFASSKIKSVVMQNINIKEVYTEVNNFFKKTLNNQNTADIKTTLSQKTAVDSTSTVSSNKEDTISVQNIKVSFIPPIIGSITSPFGERTDPFSDNVKMHTGIDIEASNGDKIKASAEGVVILVEDSKDYGNYLKIMHKDGIVTLYAHCSKIIVKKGQKVNQGEIIAEVGSTGASTGAHLHFEVIKDNKAVNPLNYIELS